VLFEPDADASRTVEQSRTHARLSGTFRLPIRSVIALATVTVALTLDEAPPSAPGPPMSADTGLTNTGATPTLNSTDSAAKTPIHSPLYKPRLATHSSIERDPDRFTYGRRAGFSARISNSTDDPMALVPY
jgi:hypothetical protein